MQRSKAELEKKSADHQVLKQLTEHRGWAIVQKMLTDEFNDALDQLTEPNSPGQEAEARGAIKFIKKFTDALNAELRIGEAAKKEYVKKYVNPPKDQQSE